MLEASIAGQMRVNENQVGRTVKLLRKFNEQTLVQKLEQDEKRLIEVNQRIRPLQSQNWALEKDIQELDDKIGSLLALRNERRAQPPSTPPPDGADARITPFEGGPNRQELFEKMFSLLIHDPKYLAVLSHKCPKVDCTDFVKTVVVDIYGGRSMLEPMQLKMFEESMKLEFIRCRGNNTEDSLGMGSLFRSGTASMQMLKEYALQGDGKDVIRNILAEPIGSLSEHNLNLEIESIRMYKEFIKKYESDTNKDWPHAREVSTASEAFNKPYIQKLYVPRIRQLEFVAEHFLKCVISKHESLPWGVRWICRKLAELGQEYFPDHTPYDWGSIVGGFLFLRLLNPAIINPKGFQITDNNVSKNTQRTLQFTAKILMKLLNGQEFREVHMLHLNGFMERKKEIVQSFIVKLISVHDLDHRLDMYRLMKHSKRDIQIQTTYNQLILMHRLLVENKKLWTNPDPDQPDPMLAILIQLGPVITQRYKKAQDRTVTLRLTLPEEDEFIESRENLIALSQNDEVLRQTLHVLQDFANNVSMDDYIDHQKSRDFFQFVQHVASQETEDSRFAVRLLEQLDLIVEHLQVEDPEMTCTQFLIQYTEQLKTYRQRVKKLATHVKHVEKALKSIKKHNRFLRQKLSKYQDAYKNVHQQTVNEGGRTQDTPNEVRFSHRQLEEREIILWVKPEHRMNFEHYCEYIVRRVDLGVYEIVVETQHDLAGFDPFDDPFRVTMMELLDLERQLKDHITIHDMISLNAKALKTTLRQIFQDY